MTSCASAHCSGLPDFACTLALSDRKTSCGRLNPGHRMLGKRRWDEAIQRIVEACPGEELRWYL